jgi:UDP-2-acetamido-2-deoxy-ribo-hexuluronate aminotransferase
MEFIDLKAQYRALRREINTRIQAVLEHGQYPRTGSARV